MGNEGTIDPSTVAPPPVERFEKQEEPALASDRLEEEELSPPLQEISRRQTPEKAQILLQGQTRILERVARGEELKSILNDIAELAEKLDDGPFYSILLLEEGRFLRLGAAPSLPDDYNKVIDGIEIGPKVGSCGTAAYRKEPVFVPDISTDPLWEDFRDLAWQHHLRSCISIPIFSRDEAVLGTIALYRSKPKRPRPDEMLAAEAITSLAAIAIERARSEEILRRRARRQAAVSDLGQKALVGSDLTVLMEEASKLVAEQLDVRYCKVLELLPGGEALLLRAGSGWEEGLVGTATVGAGLESQAGFTLLSQEPVIVWDLRTETRFQTSALLRERGVVSGIDVAVLGQDGPWGIMGAHDTRYRAFTLDDLHFFQAVANVLAAAIERERVEEQLREETRAVETINAAGRILAAELDLNKLLQAVTDAGKDLVGAQFGAFFYNNADESGENYLLYTLSGAPREAFSRFPHPRATEIFGPTFRGEGVIRLADVTQDPRYGKNPPYYGMPPGHLPVRSYLAAPVISRSGEVLGGLFFGHEKPGVFTEWDEQVLTGIVAQSAVAIDNARLYQISRTTEEKLREQAEELIERDRAKDEFLAMLAHELRNPLAPIVNAAYVMEMRQINDPILDRARGVIQRQAQQMSRLVEDLLDVSRITRGKIELKRDWIDFRTVAENAVQTSRPALEERRHDLRLILPDSPLLVYGDSARLEQVLVNLLNNAAKFTEPGGEIGLLAEREDEDRLIVRVCDNGKGIPPEKLRHIFDLFAQVDSVADRTQGGLGLGLTLVDRLVRMHGGTVAALSEGPGCGSEFVIHLPASGHPVERPRASESPSPNGASFDALVADADPDAAREISQWLEREGHRARVALTGQAALQEAAAHPPDLVFLNLELPDMKGEEVARALKSRESAAKITLVAVSDLEHETDRQQSRVTGFDYRLTQPVDPELLQTILRAITKRRD
jgi:signal transduction histidine kinase/CheY-like chemotaxis protein